MFFGTSRLTKVLGTTGIVTATTAAWFSVWTKHCQMSDLPVTDPLFVSIFYKRFNPRANPSMNDVCVRRIPLSHLRPDLLEDAQDGGSKLVEAFCRGIFAGKGYTIQRLIHGRNRPSSTETSALIQQLSQAHATANLTLKEKTQTQPPPSESWTSRLTSVFSSTPSPRTPPTLQLPSPQNPQPNELWTKRSLETSSFPQSTIITNHFLVLSRSPPTSILLRCGDSPLTNPHSPRDSDGLFELSANCNFERGYAEFTLKSIFYNGSQVLSATEKTPNEKPMGKSMEFLHRQYTKLWMEGGVNRCRLSKWRSFDKQRELIREEMKKEKEMKEKEARGMEMQGTRLLEEKK